MFAIYQPDSFLLALNTMKINGSNMQDHTQNTPILV